MATLQEIQTEFHAAMLLVAPHVKNEFGSGTPRMNGVWCVLPAMLAVLDFKSAAFMTNAIDTLEWGLTISMIRMRMIIEYQRQYIG